MHFHYRQRTKHWTTWLIPYFDPYTPRCFAMLWTTPPSSLSLVSLIGAEDTTAYVDAQQLSNEKRANAGVLILPCQLQVARGFIVCVATAVWVLVWVSVLARVEVLVSHNCRFKRVKNRLFDVQTRTPLQWWSRIIVAWVLSFGASQHHHPNTWLALPLVWVGANFLLQPLCSPEVWEPTGCDSDRFFFLPYFSYFSHSPCCPAASEPSALFFFWQEKQRTALGKAQMESGHKEGKDASSTLNRSMHYGHPPFSVCFDHLSARINSRQRKRKCD